MLASLLGVVLSGEASATAKRLKTQVIVYSILGLLSLIGLIFLLVAAYIYAAQRLGALPAALWFGGGLLGVVIVVYGIYRISARASARRAAARRRADLTGVAAATALAVLPAVASRGGAGLLVAPLIAAVGYQIYKENSGPSRSRRFDDDEGQ